MQKWMRVCLIVLLLISSTVAVSSRASQSEWVNKTPPPLRIYHPGGVVVPIEGKIYAVAPISIDTSRILVYDPELDQWEEVITVPRASYHVSIAKHENKMYVMGAWGHSGSLPDLWMFDPRSRTWEDRAPMPTARAGVGAAVFNSKIYVAGGFSVVGAYTPPGTRGNIGRPRTLNVVEVYDPATDSWQTVSPLKNARNEFALVPAGGKLYAMGGNRNHPQECDDPLTIVPTVEVFDGANWIEIAELPTPRSDFGVAVVGTQIYTIGGYLRRGNTTVVEVYDTALEIWESAPSLPVPASGVAATTVNDVIYAIGHPRADWCGLKVSSMWALPLDQ